ncbi:MAG: D-alanyl-lipoteichoic acid biosynthesis protein DltD [Bacteroidetes bacterium]|nr:D-alanyl-lipoteichoic acid biosynthesis protein DltD [Bacteroidota bacterium]
MKKLIIFHLFPVLICLAVIFIYNQDIKQLFSSKIYCNNVDISFRHIDKFSSHPGFEDIFLSTGDTTEIIWMLGSSELGVNTEATPYNFINDNFKTHLKGVGHAGNQSFSIFSALLANVSKLENAPIIILVSPGWFHSESAAGTSASVFLEFNSTSFLDKIAINDADEAFRMYESKRVSELYDEFSNPGLAMKVMNLENHPENGMRSQIFSYPINLFYSSMLSLRKCLLYSNWLSRQRMNRNPILTEEININWDSLILASSEEQSKKCGNNHWGVDSDYYNEYVNGNTSVISIISDNDNQELKDFCMLVKLLKEKKANASFVIQPINPFYYTNAPELNGLISKVEMEISMNSFPCLNLWNADSITFEKSVLKDIMHLSSCGWYKVDKFIVETYNLSR